MDIIVFIIIVIVIIFIYYLINVISGLQNDIRNMTYVCNANGNANANANANGTRDNFSNNDTIDVTIKKDIVSALEYVKNFFI